MTGDTIELRADLPEVPKRMLKLPRFRGYPVPYFVTWWAPKPGTKTPDLTKARPRGKGVPEFRIVDPNAGMKCAKEGRCWVCGGKIFDSHFAYVAGPMCAVNRTSGEPPSHVECADFSARGCPFLARPHMDRREMGLPPLEERAEIPGQMIDRNPGVGMVWIVSGAVQVKEDDKGHYLFHLHDPEEVRWYARGRLATALEVRESVESGLPFLLEAVPDAPQEAIEELHAEAERVLARYGPHDD